MIRNIKAIFSISTGLYRYSVQLLLRLVKQRTSANIATLSLSPVIQCPMKCLVPNQAIIPKFRRLRTLSVEV